MLPSQEPLNDANTSGIGPDIEVTMRNFLSISCVTIPRMILIFL